MRVEAPYLQAIQSIAGTTPGEKYKTINIIARQIAEAERSSGHSVDADSKIPDVPELLMPLIRVEVAKILHKYEGIVEGLKSEDITVVNRALKAKWFFDGSDSSFVNAKYFMTNVFPEISLYARFRVVNQLSLHLKNTEIAADFFLTLLQQYDISQAVPLLLACDEDFAFKMVIEKKIVLRLRLATALYWKYPNLIMKYLMLDRPIDINIKRSNQINIADYKHILANFANTRVKDFMKIYEKYGILDILLQTTTGINTFFVTHKDLLVEKPVKYLGLLSLETVTQNLSVEEFEKMFKNLFPTEQKDFKYSKVNEYLQYYQPERERISLILKTFREVYGKDLLSCKDLVDVELMEVLPEVDRVQQARLKLAEDSEWHHEEYIEDPLTSWGCHLPTSESIPIMTKQMAGLSTTANRGSLLGQLACTCKINDDKDALLEVLIYGYGYRNDQQFVIFHFISKVSEYFDLPLLSTAHWEILDKYINYLEMKLDAFGSENTDTLWNLMEAGLHYRLLNGLPLDDYVCRCVNVNLKHHVSNWNILTENPDFEKKLFDMIVEVIMKQYPSDNENWSLINGLVEALWRIKTRSKASHGKFNRISVKDYPWLFEKLKIFIQQLILPDDYHTTRHFLIGLPKNEPDLYNDLIDDFDKFSIFYDDIFGVNIRKRPQTVLNNWQAGLEKFQSQFKWRRRKNHNPACENFIRKSRWYQDLPIKFFNYAFEKCNDKKNCVNSAMTLALLTDGKTYSKFIESLMHSSIRENIDENNPKSKIYHELLSAYASNLSEVNPPVSLETIEIFSDDRHLKIALRSLMSVSRRTPVSKVIQFAETLANRQSLTTSGIELIEMVAPLERIYTFLTGLWNKESHTSFGVVIFSKIHAVFCKHPNPRSWRMIRTCLENLDNNTDEKIFGRLLRFSKVPNEYRDEYFKYILKLMKSIEQKSEARPKLYIKVLNKLSEIPNEYRDEYFKYILKLMKSIEQKSEAQPKLYIDVLNNLIKDLNGPVSRNPLEEYIQNFIRKHLFAFENSEEVFGAAMELTIDNYLLESKFYNESRMKFFGNVLRDSVTEYWDKPEDEFGKSGPIHIMIYKFFTRICSKFTDIHDVRIFEHLLEIFQSVLEPYQDALSYLEIIYSIEYHKSESSLDFGKRLVVKIPELIEIFSLESVGFVTDRLTNFLKSRNKFWKLETNNKALMTVIEVFANSRNIYCGIIAAKILLDNDFTEFNERRKTVVHTLRKFNHPTILYSLNEPLATFELPKPCNVI